MAQLEESPATTIPVDGERRWPVVMVLFAAAWLISSLPGRYQVTPAWFPWLAFAVVAAPMIVVSLNPQNVRWHRIERRIVFGFAVGSIGLLIVSLLHLVSDMAYSKHHYDSLELLYSAVTIWTINILSFSLLYWLIDRKGPEARASDESGKADFHFGEYDGDAQIGGRPWAPRFMDYGFLAFATSTSFTPPDYARPASRRSKLLVMAQATISLTTLVLIASRAVATLS